MGTTKRPRTDTVAGVIPNIKQLWERAVGEAERLLRKGDAEAARENLRAWMGEVRMTPLAEGGLVAEARLDGTALLQKILGRQQGNQRHRNVVAGARFGATQEVSCASAIPLSCSTPRSGPKLICPRRARKGIRSPPRTCTSTSGRGAGVAGGAVASEPPRFGFGTRRRRRSFSICTRVHLDHD